MQVSKSKEKIKTIRIIRINEKNGNDLPPAILRKSRPDALYTSI